ncbi:MAG: hypothetical protein ACFBSC_04335 [Microcoleaceae cyanobacterium]
MSGKLFPLSVPSGWAIVHNTFADEDPIIQNGWIVNSHAYNEDLLLIRPIRFEQGAWQSDPQGYSFRLGWYPHSNPHGGYRLIVHQGQEIDNNSDARVQYDSPHRQSIGQAIASCFKQIQDGYTTEQIQQQLQASKSHLEHNPRRFAGTRKSIVQTVASTKHNRLNLSQVGLWSPAYYEFSNMVYLDQKPNQMTSLEFAAENVKS